MRACHPYTASLLYPAAAGKSKVFMNRTDSEGVILPPEYVNGLPLPHDALDALTDQQLGAPVRGGPGFG